MKCSFGCGRDARYLVNNGQLCCSKTESTCPAVIEKFNKLADREQIEKDGLDIEIITVAGFRSSPKNKRNDMVQVTASMSKTTFKRLQQYLNIEYNEE